MFRTSPRWLQALLVGQFVNAAGSLAWVFLTVYLVRDRGLAVGAAGLVTAAYGAGTITGNFTGGSLGDRIGLRPALVLAQAGWVLLCLAYPVSPTAVLAPLGLAAGLVGGGSRPLMSALVASSLPTERRRQGIAMSRAAFNAGSMVGPPLGGLLAAHHFADVFVVDALTSALLLTAVLRWCPDPRPVRHPDTPRSTWAALRADRPMQALLGSVTAVDLAWRLLYTVLPVFLVERGAPLSLYGLTVTLNCLVVVLAEPRLARRLAHFPAVPVIAAGYLLVGLGWLLLAAVPTVPGAFVAIVVLTAGEVLYKPTATARAADLAPPGMAGRYQSLYAGASVSGLLLSPLLGTAFYQAVGHDVFWLGGLVAAGAAVLFGRRSVIHDFTRLPLRQQT